MSYVDSIYSFGIGRGLWAVLRNIIRDDFLVDGEPVFSRPTGGLRRQGDLPNLTALIQETIDLDRRTETRFRRFQKLTEKTFEQAQQLGKRMIIFTDPISPTKMDPDFLVSYSEALDMPVPQHAQQTYRIGKPGRVWHDPFSPMFAQTDALLLMAAVNPEAWNKVVFWPVSFVPFPAEISTDDDVTLSYVFPDFFDHISQGEIVRGRIGLGSKQKRLEEVQLTKSRGKIGTFSCNIASFDRDGLEAKFIEDPLRWFGSRIKRYHKGRSWDEAKALVQEEIAYDIFLKREMAAAFYARMLEAMGMTTPVLYAPKGSVSAAILTRAVDMLNGGEDGEYKVRFVGKDDEGPLADASLPAHRELETKPLEKLNGWIVNPQARITQRPPNLVKIVKSAPGNADLVLRPCPYAPVKCEAVYEERDSCARDEGETAACSRDLFERLKDAEFCHRELNIERDWVGHFNKKHPDKPIRHLADFVQREVERRKVIFYSAEQIAWLLNQGPNFPVFTAADFCDDARLDIFDKRRRKGRASWYAERGSDVIFPFAHEGKEVEDKFGRISSFNTKCELARILAVHDVPPRVYSSEAAVFGTCVHFLINGALKDETLLQESLWRSMGMPTMRREVSTERPVALRVLDQLLSGHSDQPLLKGPEVVEAPKGSLDVVVVDYKTSRHTPQPSRGHVLQLGSYGFAYAQMYPEMDVRNIYVCIVANPSVTEEATGVHDQHMSMVRIEKRKGDYLHDMIVDEHQASVAARLKLLSDFDAVHEYKQGMADAGLCKPYDGKKIPGCFDDARAQCATVFKNIARFRNLHDFLEKR